jgi:hypothetical protein
VTHTQAHLRDQALEKALSELSQILQDKLSEEATSKTKHEEILG